MRKDEIRILKYSICFSLLIISSLILGFSYYHYTHYHFIDKGKIIAKIDNFNIYEKDILTRLAFLETKINKKVNINNINEELFKALIFEKYINNHIINIYKKSNKKDLNNFKFLTDEYFKRLLTDDYIKKYIFNNITEEDIKNKYDEKIKIVDGKEEREIYHILFNTEDEALRAFNLVQRKGNFESIASSKSLDEATRTTGGNIGWTVREELDDQEFANLIFLLKIGEISKPIRTKHGWHLVKVNDARKIQYKSYEDSKEDLVNELKEKKYNEFIKNFNFDNKKIQFFIQFKKTDEINNNEKQTDEDENDKTIENILLNTE